MTDIINLTSRSVQFRRADGTFTDPLPLPVFLPAFAAGVIIALLRVSPTVALGLTAAPENPATATRDLLQQLITTLTQDMLAAEKVGDAAARERAEVWRSHVINICADAMRDDEYAAKMWVEMEKAATLF